MPSMTGLRSSYGAPVAGFVVDPLPGRSVPKSTRSAPTVLRPHGDALGQIDHHQPNATAESDHVARLAATTRLPRL